MTKSGREVMEIFEAFDLTGTAWSAAQLTGCDAKTVARYVAVRDAGGDPLAKTARPRLIDEFMDKVEELVDRSKGKIRAEVAHRKLAAMGYRGSERSTRRAVAEVKQAWNAGRRRRYRPWIPEPGMWLQWDWGDGPADQGPEDAAVRGWLAWSRFRVVIPVWDQQMGTLTWCVDQALRAVGGAPTYLLTDNARTVTMDHVAGIPVRHPEMVALGRHYGCKVETCVPFDPESKGGVEATVKIAKADLVPSGANLLPDYGSFANSRTPAASSVTGSTPGSTGRPQPRRPRGWRPSGSGCTRCRASLTPSRWARSGWSATTRRSGSGRSATPLRPATPAAGCGAGPPGRSWSSLPAPPGARQRSHATACLSQAARPSATSTTRTTRAATGRASPGQGQGPKPRLRSWPSATAPGAGWPRQPPPARSGSARRWPARSSWPPWSERTGSTRRSGWRRSPAGSPPTTWPRSSTTWPPRALPARS